VKLGQLMEIRAPLYAEMADITINTDNRKVRNVAEDILRELDAAGAGR
jgi:shikimate kinase